MTMPPFDASEGEQAPAPRASSDPHQGAQDAKPAKRRKPPAPPSPDDGRPLITLNAELRAIVDSAVEALRSDPDLYERDGYLVHVVRATVEEAERERGVLAGTPRIRMMAAATLRERLTSCARWQRFDARAGAMVRAIPTDHVVQAILARGSWPGLRPLVGVIEAPALRPDGSLLDRPGYDPATRYLLAPSIDFGHILHAPSQDDARRALAALEDIFCDFPHKSRHHLSTAIAAILTLLARPAIQGNVPAYLYDAATPGSGKGLSSDLVSTIATGRPSAKMNWPTDEAELEKVLASYAMRGAAIINFDNVITPFGGGPLDRCLTSGGYVDLRVLGKSEILSLPWRTVVFATGNNIVLGGDTSRRVIVSRLESDLENPERREGFKYPDIVAHVERHRASYVRAALTILRAFILAGRPRCGCEAWGSFGSWASLIPPAIVFAGGADPLQTRPAVESQEEPAKLALGVLLRNWGRLDTTGNGQTAKSMLALLYTPERLRGQAPPDGFDDLREAIEALAPTKPGQSPNPAALGRALRGFRGRVVNGHRLEATTAQGGVLRWRVVAPKAADEDVEREGIQGEPEGAAAAPGPRGSSGACAFDGCQCATCGRCKGCTARTPAEGGCSC